MEPIIHEMWGMLYKGRVFRVKQGVTKSLYNSTGVHNTGCFDDEFIKAIKSPIIITTHNYTSIPTLTMQQIFSFKLLCLHPDERSSNPALRIGSSSPILTSEKMNIFHHPKRLELDPKKDRVICVMSNKQVAAFEIRVSNVQVLTRDSPIHHVTFTPLIMTNKNDLHVEWQTWMTTEGPEQFPNQPIPLSIHYPLKLYVWFNGLQNF